MDHLADLEICRQSNLSLAEVFLISNSADVYVDLRTCERHNINVNFVGVAEILVLIEWNINISIEISGLRWDPIWAHTDKLPQLDYILAIVAFLANKICIGLILVRTDRYNLALPPCALYWKTYFNVIWRLNVCNHHWVFRYCEWKITTRIKL